MDVGALTPGYGSSVDLGAPPIPGFLKDFKENPDVFTEYDDLTFDLHIDRGCRQSLLAMRP